MVPIIRLELQSMKEVILNAFSEKILSLDADMQRAVEAYCTPENIAHVITEHVNIVLDTVIKEEVQRFYTYGEGRSIIREAVEKRLKDNKTYTPIDNI